MVNPVRPETPSLTWPGSPPRLKAGRETWHYRDKSAGCSFVPTHIQHFAHTAQNVERAARGIEPLPPFRMTPTDTLLTPLPPVTAALMAESVEDTRTHFGIRLALILQQLIFCYKTGMMFSTAKNSARAEAVVGQGGGDYEAAHSSTIPRVVYEQNGEELVLAGRTSFFHSWNTTVLLPLANKTDSAIDGYHVQLRQTHALRAYALLLLDRVAQTDGRFTPLDGLTAFLGHAKRLLETYLQITPPESFHALVGTTYLSVVSLYQYKLGTDPGFFPKLCFCRGEVSPLYFTHLRDQMHGKVSVEGAKLPIIAPRGTLLYINRHRIDLELTPTTIAHAGFCSGVETIRLLAATYLRTAHIVTDHTALKSVSSLGKVMKSKHVSAEMKALFKVCNDHLLAHYKKKPQRLDVSIQYLLTQL